MVYTKSLVENSKKVLEMLETTGPDERWKVARQAANLSLQIIAAKLDYDKMHGRSNFSDEDRANIKEAVELRRQVYRKVKSLNGS